MKKDEKIKDSDPTSIPNNASLSLPMKLSAIVSPNCTS
jgi:hypothetical protein